MEKKSFHLKFAVLERILMRENEMKMRENWKKQFGNGVKVGVIFMDISKAFDVISRSLLLTKVKACRFSD